MGDEEDCAEHGERKPLLRKNLEPHKKPYFYTPTFWVLCFNSLIMNAGVSIVVPTLEKYVTVKGGAIHDLAGITSVFSVGQLVGAILFGRLGDSLPTKFVLGVSLLFVSAGGVVYALSPNYHILYLARALWGFGAGATPVFYACCSWATPTYGSQRTVAIGFLTIANSVGYLVGTALSLLFSLVDTEIDGYRLDNTTLPAWFSSFLMLVGIVCFLMLPKLPEPPRYHRWLALKGKVLNKLCGCCFKPVNTAEGGDNHSTSSKKKRVQTVGASGSTPVKTQLLEYASTMGSDILSTSEEEDDDSITTIDGYERPKKTVKVTDPDDLLGEVRSKRSGGGGGGSSEAARQQMGIGKALLQASGHLVVNFTVFTVLSCGEAISARLTKDYFRMEIAANSAVWTGGSLVGIVVFLLEVYLLRWYSMRVVVYSIPIMAIGELLLINWIDPLRVVKHEYYPIEFKLFEYVPVWSYILGSIIIGLPYTTLACMNVAALALITPGQYQGLMLGLQNAMGSLGRAITPLWTLNMYMKIGPSIIYMLLVCGLFVAFIISILLYQFVHKPFLSELVRENKSRRSSLKTKDTAFTDSHPLSFHGDLAE